MFNWLRKLKEENAIADERIKNANDLAAQLDRIKKNYLILSPETLARLKEKDFSKKGTTIVEYSPENSNDLRRLVKVFTGNFTSSSCKIQLGYEYVDKLGKWSRWKICEAGSAAPWIMLNEFNWNNVTPPILNDEARKLIDEVLG